MKRKTTRRPIQVCRPMRKGLVPLALCFLAGALVSAAFANAECLTALKPLLWYSGGTFFRVLFSCSFGLLMISFAATSLLSKWFVPMSVFAIGSLVSLQSASIISAVGDNYAAKIILTVIIPGALLVPTLMTLAIESFAIFKVAAPSAGAPLRRAGLSRVIFIGALSVIASFAAAAYIYLLLPLII